MFQKLIIWIAKTAKRISVWAHHKAEIHDYDSIEYFYYLSSRPYGWRMFPWWTATGNGDEINPVYRHAHGIRDCCKSDIHKGTFCKVCPKPYKRRMSDYHYNRY